MKIIEKLRNKNNDNYASPSITIAFLGDSITHGGFECYFESGEVKTIVESKSAYPSRVKEMINILYPSAQINIINSGICGDTAINGNKRFERDILPYKPDLIIVSFGLNDACQGSNKLEEYANALREIFNKSKKIGAECIFVFQNILNTKVSSFLKTEEEKNLAKFFLSIQNKGVLNSYYEKAKKVSEENDVVFCDIYDVWKKMNDSGVDITELLSNKYNHPPREFHYYIAIKIMEKMLDL